MYKQIYLKDGNVKKEVKDEILDWLENRPKLARNISAKRLRTVRDNSISYAKGHPLKLHNKTRVYKIDSVNVNKKYQMVSIEYESPEVRKRMVKTIKRYSKDTVLDIEEFLENSQSICQLRNIDLQYK